MSSNLNPELCHLTEYLCLFPTASGGWVGDVVSCICVIYSKLTEIMMECQFILAVGDQCVSILILLIAWHEK